MTDKKNLLQDMCSKIDEHTYKIDNLENTTDLGKFNARVEKLETDSANLTQTVADNKAEQAAKNVEIDNKNIEQDGRLDALESDNTSNKSRLDTAESNITSIQAKDTEQDTNLTTLNQKTGDFVTPQMFGAVGDGVTDDTVAFQSAVDSGKNVFIPQGRYKLTSTITLPQGIVISGASRFKVYLLSSADTAFVYQTPENGGSYDAPHLYNFSLYCEKNGIRFNDKSKGCVDGDSAKQGYLMRAFISNIFLYGGYSLSGAIVSDTIGIDITKGFNCVIEKCLICNFDIGGIRLHGCDNNAIRNNRIFNSNCLIQIESESSFCSQNWIYNNDLMTWRKYAINSSGRTLYVYHNFFEDGQNLSPIAVLQITKGALATEFSSNIVSVYLDQKLVSIYENLYDLKVCNNIATGRLFPQVVFENDDSKKFAQGHVDFGGVSIAKKSIYIKNNYGIKDFDRHCIAEDIVEHKMKYPNVAGFFTVEDIWFYNDYPSTITALLNYEQKAIELKISSEGINGSAVFFKTGCGGKTTKITVCAKAKGDSTSSLYVQAKSDMPTITGYSFFDLTNDWQEFEFGTFSNCNYFAMASNLTVDNDNNRPLVKWIKFEEVQVTE